MDTIYFRLKGDKLPAGLVMAELEMNGSAGEISGLIENACLSDPEVMKIISAGFLSTVSKLENPEPIMRLIQKAVDLLAEIKHL